MPGVTPHTFKKGEEVKIRVNRLTSSKTLLPYEYYSLPFPRPHRGVIEQPENLGEYLTGNRIENSGYHLKFLENENCKYLARTVYKNAEIQKFKEAILEDYHVNWIMDNLPSAAAIDDYDTKTQTVVYDLGFPVGKHKHVEKDSQSDAAHHYGTYWLYNHAKMSINYHCPTGTVSLLTGSHCHSFF
jgi:transmembrane 9 superfamily protein 2/4